MIALFWLLIGVANVAAAALLVDAGVPWWFNATAAAIALGLSLAAVNS